MLEQLARRRLALDTLVIVDNGDAQDPAPLVGSGAAREVAYLHTGDNLGPAGGLHVGSAHALAHAARRRLGPVPRRRRPTRLPGRDRGAPRVRRAAAGCRPLDRSRRARRAAASTAVVASFRRVADDELSGAVPVDYVGGGQLPLYRAGALAGALPEPGSSSASTTSTSGSAWEPRGTASTATAAPGSTPGAAAAGWASAMSGRRGSSRRRPGAPTTRTATSCTSSAPRGWARPPPAERPPSSARPWRTCPAARGRRSPRSARPRGPSCDGWRGRLGRTVEPG